MCACAPSDSAAISRRRNHEAHWSPKKKARPSGRAWCCSREPAPDVRAPEIRIDQGRFCAVPERATAPGPGRSAAVSTSALNVSGMQKMLASLAGLAGPPVVIAPAAAPDSTIVRATLDPVNAPEVRWPQLVKPGDCVWPEQSAFDAHGIGRQGDATLHGGPVVPVLPPQTVPPGVPPQRRANELRALFLQYEQNTFVWSVRSTAVLVTVPVLRTKAIGSAPRPND